MAIEITEGKNTMLAALPSTIYIQLHTAAPGAAGTTSVAGETTRKSVTLGSASSGTRKTSTAAEWTAVSTSETYKYISLWSAASAGTPYWAGALEAEKTVSAGDTFKIASEGVSVTLT
jgi:hypothetical protein